MTRAELHLLDHQDDPERWLTTTEVAVLPFVRRTRATIAAHAAKKILPGIQDPISKRWRFRLEDVRLTYGAPRSPSVGDAVALVEIELMKMRRRPA